MNDPAAIRFTCARCGRDFPVDGPGGRSYQRIGGKTVCSRCAAKRFPRRPHPSAAIGPNTVACETNCRTGASQTNP